MTDLRSRLAAHPLLDGLANRQLDAIISTMVDPANHAALVAQLTEASVLAAAGCWDAPDVTDKQIAEAEADLAGWVSTLNDSEGDGMVALECEQAQETLNRLREVRDRVTVYYEDEDRPVGAIPLYRLDVGEADRG